MTALAVDASVLVALVTESDEGEWAGDLLAGANALVAPHLVLAEAANILRRARLAKKLSQNAAAAAYEDLLLLDLELFPLAPLAERIWQLTASLTVYDAWYVAVAEFAEAPLATLDRRLSRAAGPRCAFRLPN